MPFFLGFFFCVCVCIHIHSIYSFSSYLKEATLNKEKWLILMGCLPPALITIDYFVGVVNSNAI